MSTDIENEILGLCGASKNPADVSPIFILSAPRTGSTSVYKLMIEAFQLPYISNFTNDNFPTTPVAGLALQRGLPDNNIEWISAFGKTPGLLQPSEGSGVLMNWFGGGHPSQTTSTKIVSAEREQHFIKTLSGIYKIYGKNLVVKNPWNAFRVKYLAQTFPNAKFIVLSRDVVDAASSDLQARYATKDNPNEWNSATPANVEDLLKLIPEYQVVENQYEFYKAINSDLQNFAPDRWRQVWFEDIISDSPSVLKSISELIGVDVKLPESLKTSKREKVKKLDTEQRRVINEYIAANHDRLGFLLYETS